MSHQSTDCSSLVCLCIDVSGAPLEKRGAWLRHSVGFEEAETHTAMVQKTPKYQTKTMRFIVGFRTWDSGCLRSIPW